MTVPKGAAVHDLVIDVRAEDGGRRRLALSGELDLASASALADAVSQLCADGAREIVLDIGALEFIDSTGLRAILSSRVVCAASSCALIVSPEADKVNPQVRRLLQVTGLLERLPFADGADAQRPE
ncbi:MAG TPA: STAS domain-containing protein [Solirubrobacteraceae bacterium]|nr:STAS domain-containing protein [Solirubrobacteraceae bacterium]